MRWSLIGFFQRILWTVVWCFGRFQTVVNLILNRNRIRWLGFYNSDRFGLKNLLRGVTKYKTKPGPKVALNLNLPGTRVIQPNVWQRAHDHGVHLLKYSERHLKVIGFKITLLFTNSIYQIIREFIFSVHRIVRLSLFNV